MCRQKNNLMDPKQKQLIEAALDNALDAKVLAHKLCRAVTGGETVTGSEARELTAKLTMALAAAQSFESLVAGNPPPKVG
jgi:hypothetical protein